MGRIPFNSPAQPHLELLPDIAVAPLGITDARHFLSLYGAIQMHPVVHDL